jgi:hypothetical protein
MRKRGQPVKVLFDAAAIFAFLKAAFAPRVEKI